jgi:hypothetical protein
MNENNREMVFWKTRILLDRTEDAEGGEWKDFTDKS